MQEILLAAKENRYPAKEIMVLVKEIMFPIAKGMVLVNNKMIISLVKRFPATKRLWLTKEIMVFSSDKMIIFLVGRFPTNEIMKVLSSEAVNYCMNSIIYIGETNQIIELTK